MTDTPRNNRDQRTDTPRKFKMETLSEGELITRGINVPRDMYKMLPPDFCENVTEVSSILCFNPYTSSRSSCRSCSA